MLHAAASLGVGRRDSETASEALHRLASEGRCDPTAAAALAALGQQAGFAPIGTRIDGARAGRLAEEIVAQLEASADRRTRLLAPVRVPVTAATDRVRDLVSRTRRSDD